MPTVVRAPVNLEVRARVKLRDGHKCLACHATANLTIDHIRPRCAPFYGGNNEENLQLLCETCNGAKANTVVDFRSMDRKQREAWVEAHSTPLARRIKRRKERSGLPHEKVYDFATDTYRWVPVAS